VEQRDAWARILGPQAGDLPGVLARQFDLNLPTIEHVASTAAGEGPKSPTELEDRVWSLCLASARPRLDTLAQRIEPKASWDDLVLPPADKDQLRRIAQQVRHRSTVYDTWGVGLKMNRGLGISALFSGMSGTGKTMAAEVIAQELKLNLYRIDLSGLMSKYIGETEKNLRKLFDAAENGGTILFFDEADALFGRRTEIKDSHDRYANIEVNYLLQRMEAYRGLAILATNMKSALDPAFVRRIRHILDFPFPSRADREEIWRRSFGPGVKTAELDWARLASMNLAGGSIHNIALNATFAAADADGVVTMPMVLDAARIEFRKLERLVNDAEFSWEDSSAAAEAPAGRGASPEVTAS
jgi:SpoVK/Ycf46/Vps4 family AAA+-type ATPase